MKTKQIWANLPITDLERTKKFYEELGFTLNNSVKPHELISFSFGENNFIINFFLKDILETNTKMKFSGVKEENEIIFSLSAKSKEEVDEWVQVVENAGGIISTTPYTTGEGYTFGFSDPDGHKFNVLYWPGM
ncbi:VOC family protein [Chryseobacterium taiwanense]|uniref:Glyoxalase n=1 Tax=Chryseobacterium taiwanense TaxID=363331 RepID=A0A0B4E8S8_9FLAO|nr:VOC family protein [Chryseobacterium taiwanense]KIC63038.1 glyoxalase [Chryseobacterium taiwanense]